MSGKIFVSSNRLMAVVALALGVIAVFGDPYHSAADIEAVDARDILWVDSLEVARELVEGKTDLRLLDLRERAAYDAYHLPRAEHVSLDELADPALEPGERVVVYGGDSDVAEALAILQAQGIQGAKALRGGMSAWQVEILHPVLAESSTPEQIEAFRALRGISLQLGGEPVGGEDLLADQVAKPRPKLELPSAASLPMSRKKKASEGC